jgi:MSHA pilin protein MshC
MKHSGFTITELVVVLVITGVLAAVAVPRFFVSQQYKDRGFYDQALAISRFAQKSAIALRRNVCVNIASPSINLTYASAAGSISTCDTNLPSPVGGTAPFTVTAPSGVTLSPSTTIIFTALGSVSSAGATTTITVSSRTITVESGTGYVH